MSRLSDATSRRFRVPLAGFGEPPQDYLRAAAKAGLPPVAAVKALLDRGVRRGVGADLRDGAGAAAGAAERVVPVLHGVGTGLRTPGGEGRGRGQGPGGGK